MKFLSFRNLHAYLGFSSYIASKPSLLEISAEAAAPRLLLWQTARAAGSVSPLPFHPVASASISLCIAEMSRTAGLCFWWRLAEIITNNCFISVWCCKPLNHGRGGLVLHSLLPGCPGICYLVKILPVYGLPCSEAFYYLLSLYLC